MQLIRLHSYNKNTLILRCKNTTSYDVLQYDQISSYSSFSHSNRHGSLVNISNLKLFKFFLLNSKLI